MLKRRRAGKSSVLPAGYTALEYLESSGTQFLDTGLRGCDLSSSVACRAELNTYMPSMRLFQGQGFAFVSNRADKLDCFITLPIGDNLRKNGYTPALDSQEVSYFVRITNGVIEINGQSFTAEDIQVDSAVTQNDAAGATLKVLAYPDGASFQPSWWIGKLYSFSAKLQSGAVRFIPALRKADGVAGMWDTVGKQFFTNAGTGVFGYRVKGAPATYSLRDPHRVAPSGVWARLAADGTLDAVAETELDEEQATAQGYAYFANTADAAEALGATEQKLV